MQAFAVLLNQLYFTYSHLGKLALLKEYFAKAKDPDRGYALALISGELSFKALKSSQIRELMAEKIDPVLFSLSYDYVGDLAETASLLWPESSSSLQDLPPLHEIIYHFTHLSKAEIKSYLEALLNRCSRPERWALLKLGTGALRIGVSTRFVKQALAQYGNQPIEEIEKIWHALKPPYEELFAWLENTGLKPSIENNIYFHPVMLSHPLDENDLDKLDPNLFAIERKYDGIRVQLVSSAMGKALYTRTGDDISGTFPDVLEHVTGKIVLDGELVIKAGEDIGSFNALQQRLNRKEPSKKLIKESPAWIILYDILVLDGQDMRDLSFEVRRANLENWYVKKMPVGMLLSELLILPANKSLATLRESVLADQHIAVEGLMLKRKDSLYIPGRPTGQWYKWKRNPLLIDAVLMYAQRGSGKRSSYYSDYTFGLWKDENLLPIGKAYSGFTDAELYKMDKWIRNHTIAKFGPVREVEKGLVFEVAFDAVNSSKRHKSGVALRFPRIHRIRWDKPAAEADVLDSLIKLITSAK